MEGRTSAGSLGPRLAGRLTAELILRSPQYVSCVKDYEIDLRGNKISTIENLGATENQFDSIDLSDNAIVKLEGFPKLPRLKTLLLNNNRIIRIGRNLQESVPNIEWLILTGNRLTSLAELDPLASLTRLKHLSLLDNEVTKKPNYRLYVIHRCPKLKVLDFRKIKLKEREAAGKLFAGEAAAAAADGDHTFEPDEELAAAEAAAAAAAGPTPGAASKGPTADEVVAIKAAIANAQTLEEVTRLENALREGNLPSEVQVGNSNGNGNGAAPMDTA